MIGDSVVVVVVVGQTFVVDWENSLWTWTGLPVSYYSLSFLSLPS